MSASTQNQALNALVFLYKQVLGRSLDELGDFTRAKRPKRFSPRCTSPQVAQCTQGVDLAIRVSERSTIGRSTQWENTPASYARKRPTKGSEGRGAEGRDHEKGELSLSKALCRMPDYAEFKRKRVKFRSLEGTTLSITIDAWKGQNRLHCAARADKPLIFGSPVAVSVGRGRPYYAE